MSKPRLLFIPALILLLMWFVSAPPASADTTTSYTGTLATPEDTFTTVFTLASSSTVTLQTWGFGGGTNANGQVIPAGGFDPLLALFSGTGNGALILVDGFGNPIGTSDVLTNYGPYAGCPPAGTVNIGGTVCGDITMSVTLGPGTYTVLLSDGSYIPLAVNPGPPIAVLLGQGFFDLTGGAFQTCNGNTCVTDTGNWAFDLTTSGGVVQTPEPSSLLLVIGGAALLLVMQWKRTRFENKGIAWTP